MPSSLFSSTSVAITFAPSATNDSAIARPIPCPAAVTSAILPFSLPAKLSLLRCSELLYQMHGDAVTHVLGALVHVAAPRVPRNVVDERFAGVEPDAGAAEFVRA